MKSQNTKRFPSFFPRFSWDNVPLYQMFGDDTRVLTDNEVKKISATTNFICIEKQHAFKKLGAAELGAKHEFEKFKKAKPHTKCLFYFNSARAWPFTSYNKGFEYKHLAKEFRDYIITDPETGEPSVTPQDHGPLGRGITYDFDVLNEDFREWWTDTIAKAVGETSADGLFVDQMHGHAFKRPEKKREVEAAQAEMMRMSKEKMGPDKILLLNNGAHIDELFEIGDAFMLEHYDPAKLLTKENIKNDWSLLKKISEAGKIAVWRVGVETKGTDLEKVSHQEKIDRVWDFAELSKSRSDFYLSAFLIGAQEHSYFQYNWGWYLNTGPLVDFSYIGKALGAPKGDYSQDAEWTFTREFEHASVWLDLENREGKITWK